MPILQSAKKALRQSKKRNLVNLKRKQVLKNQVKKLKKSKSKKDISLLYSLADKAVKTKTIHKNKAGRIKSRLAKIASK